MIMKTRNTPFVHFWVLLFAFLITIIMSAKITNAEFVEKCDDGPGGPGLCMFNNGIVQSTQFMVRCGQGQESGHCSCEFNRYIMDATTWHVEWKDGKCLIDAGGPCGISNKDSTLELGCLTGGYECIQGRCRNPTLKRSFNDRCYEDVDCKMGLKCETTKLGFQGPIKHCRP